MSTNKGYVTVKPCDKVYIVVSWTVVRPDVTRSLSQPNKEDLKHELRFSVPLRYPGCRGSAADLSQSREKNNLWHPGYLYVKAKRVIYTKLKFL